MWWNTSGTGSPAKKTITRNRAWQVPLQRERAMTNLKTSVALLLMLTVAGCKVGPNYKRPVVNAPHAYRGLAPELAPQTAASIGDEKWFTVFHDEQLEKLIREALTQNYDVRIAATRVLQAQAALGITRADQFPTVSGGAGVGMQ